MLAGVSEALLDLLLILLRKVEVFLLRKRNIACGPPCVRKFAA